MYFTKIIKFDNLFKVNNNNVQAASTVSTPDTTTVDAFGYLNAFKLQSIGSYHKYAIRLLDLKPGEIYTFSFYALKGSATELKYSAYDLSNSREIIRPTSYMNQLTTEWSLVTLTVTAPPLCTTIEFSINRDALVASTMHYCYAQVNSEYLKPYM